MTIKHAINATLLAGGVLCLAACQHTSVEVIYTDPPTVQYDRWALFTDFSTDGLSFVRDGDDIVLEIKPTGSKTDLETLLQAIQIGAGLAAPVPTP